MADTVNITPEDTNAGDQQQHAQQMQELVDNKQDTLEVISQQQQTDSLILNKFKNEDARNKAILELLTHGGKDLNDVYKDLESQLGKNSQQQQQQESEDGNTPARVDKLTIDTQQQQIADKGLNIEKYTQEYMEQGQLSDASYKQLEKSGLNRQFIDSYIEGQRAIAEQTKTEVFEVCGGEQQYLGMLEWAQENLSSKDKQIFNANVTQGLEQAKFAVEALHARYVKANGNPPANLIHGEGTASGKGDVFESQAQLIAAMSDPRYNKDTAYRKQVSEKLSRSNIL